MARIAHITGDVRMLATIGEDGKLRDLHAIAGHPLLVQAALDAVKQWTYTPEMCPSGPEATETTIKIGFRM
jgi:protein TonB